MFPAAILRWKRMDTVLVIIFLSFSGWVEGNTDTVQPWEEHISRLHPSSSSQQQEDAVKGMLQRLLGERAAEFDIKVDPRLSSAGKDSYKISAQNGTAQISGSTGVAASSGVLYYLKYLCLCHVSWDADQLHLPATLPDASLERTAPERYRYFFNICTLSYSMPWLSWEEWQRDIDWLALNGVNLPLAPIGQEDVWRRVFLSLGLTDEDLEGYFAGPPFLAWNRMGNIQGWGGPLSAAWMSKRSALNKQIVGRMREFGMQPILPAFAGHVPGGLKRLYPSANITRLSAWGHFTDPYTRTFFLDPNDPLFKTIGSKFIQEVNQTFGTDHLYTCDPFNEMTPISSDPSYLKSLGSAVHGSMTAVDPLAVWVMQGWMFANDPAFWQPEQAKALLTSVPQGRMLVLDLAAEIMPQYRRFESFYGQPFIFCMLHNYGGVQGMFGNVQMLQKHLKAARSNTSTTLNITLVGTGMTPEGINQNYVMYDLFSDLMWQSQVDLLQWSKAYARRRYGSTDARLGQAWQILMRSVYDSRLLLRDTGQYVLVTRPDVERSRDQLWYSVADLVKAWDLIMAVARDSIEETHPLPITPITHLSNSGEEGEEGNNGVDLYSTSKIQNDVWEGFNEVERRKRSSVFIIEIPQVRMEDVEMEEEGEEEEGGGGEEEEEERGGTEEEEERRRAEEEEEEERGGTAEEEEEETRQGTEEEEREGTEEQEEEEEGRGVTEEEEQEEGRERGRSERKIKSIQEQDTFRHDVVDVTRQILQLIGGNYSLRLIDDYKNGVLLALRETHNVLQDLLQDMDSLLASSSSFLLGPWIEGAESWASNEKERAQFVTNALHQITLWGPTGEILDYANKQWSGIFSEYLRGRWALFAERLEDSLVSRKPFDQPSFNFEVFQEVERKFATDTNASYPTQPIGNSIEIALQMYKKYRPIFTSELLSDFNEQYITTQMRDSEYGDGGYGGDESFVIP